LGTVLLDFQVSLLLIEENPNLEGILAGGSRTVDPKGELLGSVLLAMSRCASDTALR
jgi:hypothetical protein